MKKLTLITLLVCGFTSVQASELLDCQKKNDIKSCYNNYVYKTCNQYAENAKTDKELNCDWVLKTPQLKAQLVQHVNQQRHRTGDICKGTLGSSKKTETCNLLREGFLLEKVLTQLSAQACPEGQLLHPITKECAKEMRPIILNPKEVECAKKKMYLHPYTLECVREKPQFGKKSCPKGFKLHPITGECAKVMKPIVVDPKELCPGGYNLNPQDFFCKQDPGKPAPQPGKPEGNEGNTNHRVDD